MIEKKEFENFAKRLDGLRVLVVGDLMLDRYFWGSVSRISPEAPVPIIDVSQTDNRPGGAANVALNISSMGAKVFLSGVLGNDNEGEILRSQLNQNGFDTSLVLTVPGRKTTCKTRLIGNSQQMLRVDSEQKNYLSKAQYIRVLADSLKVWDEIDVVIFEDYDKGFLEPEFIAHLIARCEFKGTPCVVDPKFRQFFAYTGCSLFKPNLKELNEGLNLQVDKGDARGLEMAIQGLSNQMSHGQTVVTLSENGVLAVDETGHAHHIPAHYRKITDVSGAGDSVIALLALGLAAGLPLRQSAEIANLAGGLVCEEVGVVPIDKTRLWAELKRISQIS